MPRKRLTDDEIAKRVIEGGRKGGQTTAKRPAAEREDAARVAGKARAKKAPRDKGGKFK